MPLPKPLTGLTKRIIPCLDVKDGRTVKGVNFTGLRDAGDPVALAAAYAAQGADELVFLDISATNERRKTMIDLVRSVAAELNIPFTIGGGITSIEDAAALLDAGADKISINSAAVKNPGLITALSERFGRQFVVVAVDSKPVEGKNMVFLNGGTIKTEWNTEAWIRHAEELGAGEFLLTSMDRDGTKNGFDLDLLRSISSICSVPLIASGGAGKADDFVDLFSQTPVDAALAASIFHYGELSIPDLKEKLKNNNIPVRI